MSEPRLNWDGRLAVGAKPLPEYELTRFLGGGGFGEVWEAKVSPSGVSHALKFVKVDGAGSEVEKDALEIYKRVSHSNLINLINYWILDNYLIIAMELGRKTLEDVFREEREKGREGIPIKDLLGYMADAAAGLDCLNEPNHQVTGDVRFGIQHRDIKPLNLLIVGDSVKSVKVADISLLKIMSGNVADHSNGACTPAYAAPEFLRDQGRRETTRWSDQYSLAATYCYLRCGKLPYGTRAIEIITRQSVKEPPNLEGLTEVERPVVARALSLVPKDRFENCGEFVEALKSVLKPTTPELVIPREKKDLEFGIGNTRVLTVLVRRNGFQGELSVSFANLPPGIFFGSARISDFASKAAIEVRIGENTSKGARTIKAIGSSLSRDSGGTSNSTRLVEVEFGIEIVEPAAYFANKGDDAYCRDEDQDALRYYSRAVQLDPNNKKYRIQIGNVHINLGDRDGAIRELNEAIGDPVYRNEAQAKLEMIRKHFDPGRRTSGDDTA